MDDESPVHLQGFGEFFQHLNSAAKAVLPRRSRRYAKVIALLLRWEDDDLGTQQELDDLGDVFRGIYNYQTEQYLIPSLGSTNQLEYKLTDFRRAYDSEANLLILYYGGHGGLERQPNRPSRSIWTAKSQGGSSLIWSDLQGILERANSDVVFILDCCFAATASRGAGAKEGLWASNSESTTTGVNNNSFTRNLIAELTSLHTTRFNIAILHSRLMARYRRPGNHQLLTEPWYSYLGNELVPSVELTPQPASDNSSVNIEMPNVGSEDYPQPPASSTSDHTSITIDEPTTETLVLLAVRLKSPNEVPRLVSWQDWCHILAPDDIESVHALGRLQSSDLVRLEGYFMSHSKLILVSMPIFLWDRLPPSPAYSFISFIKSPNLYVSDPSRRLEQYFNIVRSRVDLKGADLSRLDTFESDQLESDQQPYEELLHSPAITKWSPASNLWNDGRLVEAADTEEKVLGHGSLHEGHLNFLGSIDYGSIILRNHMLSEAAMLLEQQNLHQTTNLLGRTADSWSNTSDLASLYWAGRHYQAAEQLTNHSIQVRKRQFGDNDRLSLDLEANLVPILWKQGRWKEAIKEGETIVFKAKGLLGNGHPSTLASMALLAAIYRASGLLSEAGAVLQELVWMREGLLGMEHPDTFKSMILLRSVISDEALKVTEAQAPASEPKDRSINLRFQTPLLQTVAEEDNKVPRLIPEQGADINPKNDMEQVKRKNGG
ncbi:MAG: hypothetical protein LQ340_006563 [Diploschistes diacapsis]|nr:MAG: hypothetical protein LQ340_006563 [Diploschistes diacapsis]